MSFNITTARDITKPLQYVEEGTTAALYGVSPSSAAFVAAGINTEITLDPNVVSEQIRALGLEDFADIVKTQEAYAFSLRSNILNTTLAKYGTEAVGGTGTIGASLLFAFSYSLDGTQNYALLRGCRPVSTTLSVNRGLWTLDQTWHAKSINKEVATANGGLTTPTFVTAVPSGSPLKHQDGVSPFNWNSVVFSERSFSITVTRDLALLESNGDVQVLFSKAANRSITWSAEVYKESAVIKDDYHDQQKRVLTYKVGASDVATLTDSVITGLTQRHTGGDSSALIESLTGVARTLAIA